MIIDANWKDIYPWRRSDVRNSRWWECPFFQVNTFQAVIASSMGESYVFFNYPQSGLQWIKGQGKNRNMPDARGQAGIISGVEGSYYLLPGSGYDQVQKLDK